MYKAFLYALYDNVVGQASVMLSDLQNSHLCYKAKLGAATGKPVYCMTLNHAVHEAASINQGPRKAHQYGRDPCNCAVYGREKCMYPPKGWSEELDAGELE